MEKQGLTIYQDPISWAFEVYYKGERLPIRVISIRERNDLGDIEFTIETVRSYPTVFTDNRPMEMDNEICCVSN